MSRGALEGVGPDPAAGFYGTCRRLDAEGDPLHMPKTAGRVGRMAIRDRAEPRLFSAG
jgi:hypothetical protein